MHDTADWAKVTDSFSWGYQRGVSINNANSVTVLNVGADNAFDGAPLHAGSIGIEVLGTSQDTRIVAAQTAAQATAGIFVGTVDGAMTTITAPNVWGGSTHGVLVYSGDVALSGAVLRGLGNGVSTVSARSRVAVSGSRFQGIAGNPVNVTAASSKMLLGDNDYGDFTGTVGSAALQTQQLPSAALLALPNTGTLFGVMGTAPINGIEGGWAGRVVTLIFKGTVAVSNSTGTTQSVRLASRTKFNTQTGSTLTLRHDGSQWYEVGRAR